jgi:hypothetical protein
MDMTKIMELLVNIKSKLGEIIPQVKNIEHRLDQIEGCLFSVRRDTPKKSSTTNILNEVKSNAQNFSAISNGGSYSDSSDSVSNSSDPSDQGLIDGCQLDHPGAAKHGLLMSDSDMSEEAQHLGQLLKCQVTMYDYSAGNLEPSQFNNNLEFVVIQDSGKVLEKFAELTNDTVQQMTGHVHHLVKLATSILVLQPNTRVFLGSLHPRCDKGLRKELTRVFNGLLVTESFLVDRVFVIDQSQLQSRDERKFFERYNVDMFTLTKYGKKLRDKNTASHIVKSVPGLSLVRKKKPTKHHQPVDNTWQGGYRKKNKNIRSFLVNILQNL